MIFGVKTLVDILAEIQAPATKPIHLLKLSTAMKVLPGEGADLSAIIAALMTHSLYFGTIINCYSVLMSFFECNVLGCVSGNM